MIYFDSDTEKIELAKHIASIETENRMLKEQLASRNEQLPSRNETMIKFFKRGDKEQLKLVLKKVYKCQDVEQMSDTELTFCYIAKTLESLENFCEIAENANELYNHILKIEKALKYANTFDEFKSFCLEDCYDIGKHANAAGCTPKEPVNTEDNTPKEEPTMDGLAEFNLETYKEEVEADVNRARTTIDKFD